jgi:hypothetical protein
MIAIGSEPASALIIRELLSNHEPAIPFVQHYLLTQSILIVKIYR